MIAEGFYDRPPVRGLKAFAAIYAGWGTSEPFFRTEGHRGLGARSTEEHVATFWERSFLRCDANNLLSRLWTWMKGDISDSTALNGDFEAALGAIKACTIFLPVDSGRYFPLVDSENEAHHISGLECRAVRTISGHMTPMNPGDVSAIDAALTELLNG